MAHVFISYSHKDRAYAHRLAGEMKRRGIEVWIDDRINYGERWPRVIQENLEHCGAVVVLMSRNAYNSAWVQNELVFAQGLGKAIVPVLLEGNVWLSLASSQYVDVRDGALPADSFYNVVKSHLRRDTARHATATVQPGAEEQALRARIFQTLKAAIPDAERRSWKMGLFEVNYWCASRELRSYILNTEVADEELLRRHDPDVYREYKSGHEALLKKRSLLDEHVRPRSPSGPLFTEMFEAYSMPLIELRQRLNLELGRTFMHEPADAEMRQFAEELIHLHRLHGIPLAEIKISMS
jgi:hypothetical protein